MKNGRRKLTIKNERVLDTMEKRKLVKILDRKTGLCMIESKKALNRFNKAIFEDMDNLLKPGETLEVTML